MVPEVFLDFSLRERAAKWRERKSFFLAALQLAFTALWLSHTGKNQGRGKNQSIIRFLITGID